MFVFVPTGRGFISILLSHPAGILFEFIYSVRELKMYKQSCEHNDVMIHVFYKQLDFSGLRLKFRQLLSKNGRTMRYFQNFLSPNERTHFEKTFEHLFAIGVPFDFEQY